MWFYNGIPYMCEPEDIIRRLRDYALLNDRDILREIKVTTNAIMFTCPWHKNGKERKPSCGLIIRQKDKDSMPIGTVHCFGGDTEVFTDRGLIPIKELYNSNKPINIVNGNGEWESVKFSNYGKQKLFKLTISFGGNKYGKVTKDIYCTDEHRWFKLYGRGRNVEVLTKDLLPGDILPTVLTKCKLEKFDVDGLRHGFIYGDGFKNHCEKDCNIGKAVFYTDAKRKVEKYFENVKPYTHPSGKELTAALYKSKFDLTIPPDFSFSDEYILGFLIGYFAADGSFGAGKCAVSSANLEHLTHIRNLCTHLGFMCKEIKSRYRCGFGKFSYIHSFRVHRCSLPDCFDITERFKEKSSNMNYTRWRVVSVEETDLVEDVYCCQTSTGSFLLADNILTGNCFSCGTVATLEEFISNCLGVYDGGKYGAKWLASNFLSIDLGSRPKLDLSNTLSRSSNNTYIPQIEYVSEEELDRYRYIHPYMYHRKLTDDIIEKFDVGYQKDFILDPKNPKCYPIECITFPVKDINGNTLFVARRAIQTKLFHYPDSAIKPIYGLYELQKYAPKDLKEIWICESILNCLSAWRSGHYAVALNGTGSYSQIQDLKKLNYRKFVLALDPDEAGINGCRKIYEALKNEKLITRVLIPKNHDLNDLTDEEINNLQEFYMNEKLTI